MTKSDLTFDALRKLLLDLGFVENKVPGPYWAFSHPKSDALFVYRFYKPREKVFQHDFVTTRNQLDARGLLDAAAFDGLLLKATA